MNNATTSIDTVPLNIGKSINQPEIRVWEINENSTHYDKMMAAPSDYERELMWIIWASIMGIVIVFAGTVFVGIISSRGVRKSPFNVYLIFMMIPDLFMSGACFITCVLNATQGQFISPFACYFQSFYMVFGIASNGWMNAIVTHQLYTLLRKTKSCRKYTPPTRAKVVKQSIIVYIFSAFVASWGLIPESTAPWWPHKTGLLMGTACVPTDYDTPSTIFFYCVYFPALMAVPMGYVLYICYRIYTRELIPKNEENRFMAITMFLRLTVVFLVMWVPALLTFFIIGAWVPHWVVWAGGAWSHLQGLVSAAVCLRKPDIWEATVQLITCEHYNSKSWVSDGWHAFSNKIHIRNSRCHSGTNNNMHEDDDKRSNIFSQSAPTMDFSNSQTNFQQNAKNETSYDFEGSNTLHNEMMMGNNQSSLIGYGYQEDLAEEEADGEKQKTHIEDFCSFTEEIEEEEQHTITCTKQKQQRQHKHGDRGKKDDVEEGKGYLENFIEDEEF